MGLGAESDEVEKVVKVAASKGDVNTISEAIGRLREKGACLEDNFYVNLIEAYSVKKDVVGAVIAYEEMQDAEGRSSAKVSEALLRLLVENNAPLTTVVSAAKLVEENTSGTADSTTAKSLVLQSKMRAAANRGDPSSVAVHIAELRRLQKMPSVLEHEVLCQAFCRAGKIDEAEAELRCAREGNFKTKPGAIFYTHILLARNTTEAVDELSERMREGDIYEDVAFRNAKLTVLLNNKQLDSVVEILMNTTTESLPDLPEWCLRLVKELGRDGQAVRADKLVGSVFRRCGMKINKHAHRAILRAYCESNLYEEARRKLNLMLSSFPDSIDATIEADFASLIRAQKEQDKLEDAEDLLNRFRKLGMKGTGLANRAMLEVYARCGKSDKAMAQLYEMRMRSLPVGAKEYEWIVISHLQTKSFQSAVDVVERMVKNNAPPSLWLLKQLLPVLIRNNMPEAAEQILLTLDHEGRNIGCWNMILLAWAKQGNADQVTRVARSLLLKNIKPDDHTVQCVSHFFRKHVTDDVKQLVDEVAARSRHTTRRTAATSDAVINDLAA
eukprot:CAMPEP_0198728016 /NCGR_PEP_ID=MMETSP1475-20131203/6676_1 /TAXON_ID= ORGANISM="Unidentified sp., Strain CCMP1999" /NCGR_SAMPLE_ID=MMETSP1475 /ASSEMBLY_ACC=CAM_ASM_001111 /LENGTH=555 /DNA_ID=CAMNT_0044490259 /DNA_START=194 /DNA_END=1861 /DNA_ORIENTATION=+